MAAALWIAAYLIAINLLTYAVFVWDKHCARVKKRRISEATLLNLALVGGSPGAKVAQQRLRHKSYKQPFGQRLNATIIFQVVAIVTGGVLWLSPAARTLVWAVLESFFGIG